MIVFVMNEEVLNISSIFWKLFDWERQWRAVVAFASA